jgi:hypothetical protein
MEERIIFNGSNEKTTDEYQNKNINNLNYFSFFEYAPIALWIEDFSKAKLFFEKKLKQHNTNSDTLLIQYPHYIA